jgi:hypothetical protein
MNEVLKVKGSVIKEARDWSRTAYGNEAYQAALNGLAPDARAWLDGDIYASSWYPLAAWEGFLAGMRQEAFKRAGENAEVFDRRRMSETGSAILRGVYRFVLGLMSPVSVVEKATVVYNRAYNQGRCQIMENVPGRAVIRFVDVEALPEIRSSLNGNFPQGFAFVLGLHGAKDVKSSVTRDEVVVDGKLVFETTISYLE